MYNLAMGPGKIFLTRVSHLWFAFGKFPLEMSNFSIFFSSDKKNHLRVVSKTFRVKSGLASGQK